MVDDVCAEFVVQEDADVELHRGHIAATPMPPLHSCCQETTRACTCSAC